MEDLTGRESLCAVSNSCHVAVILGVTCPVGFCLLRFSTDKARHFELGTSRQFEDLECIKRCCFDEVCSTRFACNLLLAVFLASDFVLKLVAPKSKVVST
jgi:hypothetical protein